MLSGLTLGIITRMDTNEATRKQNPVLEEYARLAPIYDRKWSFYVEATIRETLARLSLRQTARVLDVGCGTGALLQELARKFPQTTLVGVDPVPEMLAVARRRLPSSVELRGGWAEELPFEDDDFDVVVSCNMFHYIRRPASALQEMSRVLRPVGELVITDWCDDFLACRVCDWYLHLFNPAHVKVYGERDCVRLLQAAGHSQPHIERYRINWLWGLMTASVTKRAA